jgi:hypothetical protein
MLPLALEKSNKVFRVQDQNKLGDFTPPHLLFKIIIKTPTS